MYNTNTALNIIKSREWKYQEIILISTAIIVVLLVILYPIISSGETHSGRGPRSYDFYNRKWNVTPILAIWGWLMILVILFFPIFYFRYHQSNVNFFPRGKILILFIILTILIFIFLGGYVWSDPIEHFGSLSLDPIVWFGLANPCISGNIITDEYVGSDKQRYSYNRTYTKALIRLFSELKNGNLNILNANGISPDILQNLIEIIRQSGRDRIPLLIPGNLTQNNTSGARTAQFNQWSEFKQLYIDNPVLNSMFQIYETLGSNDRIEPGQYLQNNNAGLTWLQARNKRRHQTILTDELGNYLALNKQNKIELYLIVLNGPFDVKNIDFLRKAVGIIGNNWFLISCNTPFEQETQKNVRTILKTSIKFLGCYTGTYQKSSDGMRVSYNDFISYPSPIINSTNTVQSITVCLRNTKGLIGIPNVAERTNCYNIKWSLEPWNNEPSNVAPMFVQSPNPSPTNSELNVLVDSSSYRFSSIDPDTKIVYVNNVADDDSKFKKWRIRKENNNLTVETYNSTNNNWTTRNDDDNNETFVVPVFQFDLTGDPTCVNFLNQLFEKKYYTTDSPNNAVIQGNFNDGTTTTPITFKKINNTIRIVDPITPHDCSREIVNTILPDDIPFRFTFTEIPANTGYMYRPYFTVVTENNNNVTITSLAELVNINSIRCWSNIASTTTLNTIPTTIHMMDIARAESEEKAKGILSKYIQSFFVKFDNNIQTEKISLASNFSDVIESVNENIKFSFNTQNIDTPPFIIKFKPISADALCNNWLNKWVTKTDSCVDILKIKNILSHDIIDASLVNFRDVTS